MRSSIRPFHGTEPHEELVVASTFLLSDHGDGGEKRRIEGACGLSRELSDDFGIQTSIGKLSDPVSTSSKWHSLPYTNIHHTRKPGGSRNEATYHSLPKFPWGFSRGSVLPGNAHESTTARRARTREILQAALQLVEEEVLRHESSSESVFSNK